MELRHWKHHAVKARSATDTSLIAVTDGTVDAHFEGCDVRTTETLVTGSDTIDVKSFGDIKVGDTLEAYVEDDWPAAANQVTVTAIDRANLQITVGATGQSVTAGQRLVIVSRRPSLYTSEDEASADVIASSEVSTDASGKAAFYIKARHFDVVITSPTADTQLLRDLTGEAPSPFLNAHELGVDFNNDADAAATNVTAFEDVFRRAADPDSTRRHVRLHAGTAVIDDAVALDEDISATSEDVTLEGVGGSTVRAKSTFSGTGMFYFANSQSHKFYRFRGGTYDAQTLAIRVFELEEQGIDIYFENVDITNGSGSAAILLGTAANSMARVSILGGTISTWSTGPAIKALYASQLVIDGVQFTGCSAGAIEIDASGSIGSRIDLMNLKMVGMNGTSLIKFTGAASSRTADGSSYGVRMSDIRIAGTGTTLIEATDLHQLRISGVEYLDGLTDNGIVVNSVRDLWVEDCVIKGDGSSDATIHGIHVGVSNFDNKGIHINRNHVYDFGGNGIFIEDTDIGDLVGNEVHDCNQTDVATHGGIVLDASGLDNTNEIKLVANDCRDNGAVNGNGILVADADVNYTHLTFNTTTGNSAGITDSGTNTVSINNSDF